MNVHFVCFSNTFRSRLANTYANSLQLPSVTFSSSGIQADKNPNGPITWYAQRIIQKNKLTPFEKLQWTQTTEALLQEQDIVIFMTTSLYEDAQKLFTCNGTYKIFDINDIDVDDASSYDEFLEAMRISDAIFEEIKQKVQNL